MLGGFIGVRLLGVTEPGYNDRLSVGSEFWIYRQERELDYISVPGLLFFVESHDAYNMLLEEFFLFELGVLSQCHPIESDNAEERFSVAFVAAERSKRASDLAPKMVICDKINSRKECWSAPMYVPRPFWVNGSFAKEGFCYVRYSSTYRPSQHCFRVMILVADSGAGRYNLPRMRVLKDKEGSVEGEEERPPIVARILEKKLVKQRLNDDDATHKADVLAKASGLF